MNKKRKKISEKNGLYIAIGCCALVIAAVGYVGNKNNSNIDKNSSLNSIPEKKISQSAVEKTEFVNESVSIEETDEKITITPKKQTKIKETLQNNNNTTEVAKPIKVSELNFKMPVEGKVICEFSDGKLLYNDSLFDWRTHNGIDISCEMDSAIYASADGVIKDIQNNSMGNTVIISHSDGFVSIYSNLSEKIEVSEGDKISSGDLIGKIGNTALADFTTEPHLHFEIMQNDKYIDPVLKLNIE